MMKFKQGKSGLVRYNQVKKQFLDGRTFDSKAEVQCYQWLKELELLNLIHDIRHQVRVTLLDGPVKMKRQYKVDFAYKDNETNEDIYVEVKGWETDRWKANLLLWRHLGPGVLRVYKVGFKKLVLVEEVVPDSSYIKKQLGVV